MTKVISLRSRYLGIPVWNIPEEEKENKERLSILKDGKTVYEFLLPISKDNLPPGSKPDHYDYLQIIGVHKNQFYPDYMTKADMTASFKMYCAYPASIYRQRSYPTFIQTIRRIK